VSNSASHGGRTLSRDYKHVRRHAQGAQGPGFTGWVGLGIGLGLGLTVALAVHLHYQNQIAGNLEPVPVAAQAPASATATDEPELPSAGGSAPQNFEFYDMLPKQEVDVPSSRRPLEEGHADRLPTGDVVLQAGSFKQATEAEKMVAQLALAGVESKVQRASVQDETWYRVRIGPIATVQELNAVRMKLDAAEINAPPVVPVAEPALP
jgi:cell division septation protein DedD